MRQRRTGWRIQLLTADRRQYLRTHIAAFPSVDIHLGELVQDRT
jgi:hypothetical protein